MKGSTSTTKHRALTYTDARRILSNLEKEKESARKCKLDQDLALSEVVKTKLEIKKMAVVIEELQRREKETDSLIRMVMDSLKSNRVKTEDGDARVQGDKEYFPTSPTDNLEFLRALPAVISKICVDMENSKRIEKEVSMRNNSLAQYLENSKIQTMEEKRRLFNTIENLQTELINERKKAQKEREEAAESQMYHHLERTQSHDNLLILKDQQMAQMVGDMKLTNLRNMVLEGLIKQHEGIIAKTGVDNLRLKDKLRDAEDELKDVKDKRKKEKDDHRRERESLQQKLASQEDSYRKMQKSASRKVGELKDENTSLVEKNKALKAQFDSFKKSLQTTSDNKIPPKRLQIMSESSMNRQVRMTELEKEKEKTGMWKSVKIEEEDDHGFDMAFASRKSSPKRRRHQMSPGVSPKKMKV